MSNVESFVFWFLNLLFLAFMYDKYSEGGSNFPIEFDDMNTMGLAPSETIKVSEIVSDLKNVYGEPEHPMFWALESDLTTKIGIHLPNHVERIVKDKINNQIIFSLLIDEKISFLNLSGSGHYYNNKFCKNIANIAEINIDSTISFLCISNLYIDRLVIEHNYNGAEIRIDNCLIRNLILKEQTDILNHHNYDKSIEIINSYVLQIVFNENCCRNFTFSGGGIRSIFCQDKDKHNPFYGSFNIDKNVYFDSKNIETWSKHVNIQGYRNLRHHINKLSNNNSDNFIYIHEMRLDCKNKSKFIRFISKFYDYTSLYGTSPERSALCLFCLFIYSSVMIYAHNAAVFTGQEITNGWKVVLSREDLFSRICKSLFLSFQSIFNPLNIFSKQSFIEPSNFYFVLWTSFQGICSITLIAIIIFSIRKQFKITT